MHPATLTRAQVREVDRIAIEELRIPGIVLMENAGRGAAHFILHEASEGGLVSVVCGGGNNGGDGFVIARHLANAGQRVEIYSAVAPSKLTGDAATNCQIVSRMGLEWVPFDSVERIESASGRLHQSEVIVDAILGTGFSGNLRSPLDSAIDAINASPSSEIVAVDLPSGLDCDTGMPSNATVRANHTVTFVAFKQGFTSAESRQFVGQVHVVDIGAPPALIHRVQREIR